METQASAKRPHRTKKALKWFSIFVFLCVLGSISLYYLYAFYHTKRITGKWFLLGKPVESFHSQSWSFHGDDCIVKIFRIPKHLQNYFINPPSTFFDYPLAPLNRKIFWESLYVKKWTTGIPTREEADFVRDALKSWNVPTSLVDTVTTSLALETSHHAYVGPGRGPRPGRSYNPANFDFFILDPLNGWLIIINQ